MKQRLAAEMGVDEALTAHEALVEDTLGRLRDCPGVALELWLDGAPNAAVERWVTDHRLALFPQQGADLGERMCHALRDALGRGARAVLIGTDCPAIDAAYVLGALDRLRTCDVVMGPAEDGGYGLVGAAAGCTARLHELFSRVPWGTSRVAATTRIRCAHARLHLEELELIWDVDTLADWQRYVSLRDPSAGSPPASD